MSNRMGRGEIDNGRRIIALQPTLSSIVGHS
jgi:hypothetical protein